MSEYGIFGDILEELRVIRELLEDPPCIRCHCRSYTDTWPWITTTYPQTYPQVWTVNSNGTVF